MKIEKYPCVVYLVPKEFRIMATVKGPVCEEYRGTDADGGEIWKAAAMASSSGHLLNAYHELMQATDCEVPKPIPVFTTVAEMDADATDD